MSMNDCVFTDYVPTKWIDGSTPVNAENLNHIEQGIYGCSQQIQSLGVGVSVLNDEVFETCMCQSGGVKSVSKIKKLEEAHEALSAETNRRLNSVDAELKLATTELKASLGGTDKLVMNLMDKVDALEDKVTSGAVTRKEFNDLSTIVSGNVSKISSLQTDIARIDAQFLQYMNIDQTKLYVQSYVDSSNTTLKKYVDQELAKIPGSSQAQYYTKEEIEERFAMIEARLAELEDGTYVAPENLQITICGVDKDGIGFETTDSKYLMNGAVVNKIKVDFTKGSKIITKMKVVLGVETLLERNAGVTPGVFDLEPIQIKDNQEYAFTCQITDSVKTLTDSVTITAVEEPKVNPSNFVFKLVDSLGEQHTSDCVVKASTTMDRAYITYTPGNVQITSVRLQAGNENMGSVVVTDNTGLIEYFTKISVASGASKKITAYVTFNNVEFEAGSITITGKSNTMYYYYGPTTNSTITAADFTDMKPVVFDKSPVEVTYTFDKKAYVTFAYDEMIGELRSILATGNIPADSAFDKMGTVTIDDCTYVVYRQLETSYPFEEYYQFNFDETSTPIVPDEPDEPEVPDEPDIPDVPDTPDVPEVTSYKYYYGPTVNDSLTEADLADMEGHVFESTPVETSFTFDKKAYVTFAYDSRIGTLKSIVATGDVPATNAFEKLPNIVTSDATYVVYRQPDKSYPFGEYYKFNF